MFYCLFGVNQIFYLLTGFYPKKFAKFTPGVAYAIQLGEFYSVEYIVFRSELDENPKKKSETLKFRFYMGIYLNFGLVEFF